jgi:uncharacterized protein YqeY
MLKQQIEQDLKAALLAGDKKRVTTLRGLKSVILYEEVAKGSRAEGLEDDQIIVLLAKEAKKRQESAELYKKGGADDRAAAELAEKAMIETYLPTQLSDEELSFVVNNTIEELNASGPQAMGQVIAKVKQQVAGQADGGRIAQLVKERLAKA